MDAGIVFYGAPQCRASMVHWLLEELGVPYRMHVLDLRRKEHKRPEYLAIHPLGKVPALVHDGVVITETAAIACYLADAFPEAGLTVPLGDRRRGPYLKWLFFSPSSLEAALSDQLLKRPPPPKGSLCYGSLEQTLDVIARALRDGPYLLGEQFTAADVIIGCSLRWARALHLLNFPAAAELIEYAERLGDRPACRRAEAKEAALAQELAARSAVSGSGPVTAAGGTAATR